MKKRQHRGRLALVESVKARKGGKRKEGPWQFNSKAKNRGGKKRGPGIRVGNGKKKKRTQRGRENTGRHKEDAEDKVGISNKHSERKHWKKNPNPRGKKRKKKRKSFETQEGNDIANRTKKLVAKDFPKEKGRGIQTTKEKEGGYKRKLPGEEDKKKGGTKSRRKEKKTDRTRGKDKGRVKGHSFQQGTENHNCNIHGSHALQKKGQEEKA